MDSATVEAILTAQESAPFLKRSGLRDRAVEGIILSEVLDPSPAYREADGSIPFGSLSFLIDTAVGLSSRLGSGWEVASVSSELSFATLGPLGPGPVSVRAQVVAFSDQAGLASGVLSGPDGGVIGQATLRSVAVPGRPSGPIDPAAFEAATFAWESDVEPAPVDRSIGAGLVLRHRGAKMTMTPTNEWASAYGALHGGAVGLFIHRAIHYAVSGALPDGDGHVPISFAISYLRPAVCGTEPVECVATITEISRRFAHIDAVMRMADGRVAARVAATHAIIRSEGPEGHVAERLA